jgi:replication factor C small subunit
MENANIKTLVDFMKEKDYTQVRKWVGYNLDSDTNTLLRSFYDHAAEYFVSASIPQLIILLAEYQYKAAFVVDPEINLASCFAEIMVNCEFK